MFAFKIMYIFEARVIGDIERSERQLVEHCTGIAEVIGSNPVEAAWIFYVSTYVFASVTCF